MAQVGGAGADARHEVGGPAAMAQPTTDTSSDHDETRPDSGQAGVFRAGGISYLRIPRS